MKNKKIILAEDVGTNWMASRLLFFTSTFSELVKPSTFRGISEK